MRFLRCVCVVLSLIGCSESATFSGGNITGDAKTADEDAAVTPANNVSNNSLPDASNRPPPEVDSGIGGCAIGTHTCVTTLIERTCEKQGDEGKWVKKPCPSHQHCVDDRCVPGCLDECIFGDKTSAGTCALYSTAKQHFIDLGSSLRDRERKHLGWTSANQLANGYVAEAIFYDAPVYKERSAFGATGDSGIWTGTYLAAEALRMMVTRSSAAEQNVEAVVERIHELFTITKAPGYMARFWAPLGVDPALDKLKLAESKDKFHETTMNGKPAFWNGNTSRDQYQGALLGYSLAYDALTSIKHRAMIRDDIVALAKELMKVRKQVPVTVRYKLGGWQTMKLLFDLQHVVMNPAEFEDGGPFIQVGTDGDSSDYGSSSLLGVREFIPDLKSVLGQVPLLGALVPPIPRSGSAVMLANIFRIAIQVTENIPSHSADNAAFRAHYNKQINSWLEVMKQYVYLNAGAKCWDAYFGINIVYQPIYNLLRLEPDATIRSTIQQQVLAKIWDLVKDHKNTYFTFITASVGAKGAVSADRLATAAEQLSQLEPPPKPNLAVDNTNDPRYPPSSQCDNHSTKALDVADRRMSDFIWQRHPFDLKNLEPQPHRVYPGIDYLVAYWMGRQYGYIDEDAAGTCLRFK